MEIRGYSKEILWETHGFPPILPKVPKLPPLTHVIQGPFPIILSNTPHIIGVLRDHPRVPPYTRARVTHICRLPTHTSYMCVTYTPITSLIGVTSTTTMSKATPNTTNTTKSLGGCQDSKGGRGVTTQEA